MDILAFAFLASCSCSISHCLPLSRTFEILGAATKYSIVISRHREKASGDSAGPTSTLPSPHIADFLSSHCLAHRSSLLRNERTRNGQMRCDLHHIFFTFAGESVFSDPSSKMLSKLGSWVLFDHVSPAQMGFIILLISSVNRKLTDIRHVNWPLNSIFLTSNTVKQKEIFAISQNMPA